MKNFTNLIGLFDSKVGYRVAKENLEFVDGKIISKEKFQIFFYFISVLQHLKSRLKEKWEKVWCWEFGSYLVG